MPWCSRTLSERDSWTPRSSLEPEHSHSGPLCVLGFSLGFHSFSTTFSVTRVSVEITGLYWQAGSGSQYMVAGRKAGRMRVYRNRVG